MTSHHVKQKALLISAAVLYFFSCGLNPPDGGNSSQTGNPALSGVVYYENGSRAANAKVCVARWNADPQDSSVIADSAVTNDTGYYAIDSLAADTFNLLASSGAFLGYEDSITVNAAATTQAPPCTLRAKGSISGVVKLENNGDVSTVFILFMGTNTFVTPGDNIGNFTALNLAEGKYRVKILTTLPDYDSPLDEDFTISAGVDAVLPDTIRLHYTGIPVPQGLRIEYDTMKQIVTLSWNQPTTGIPISGYNIYRKHQDSAISLLKADWQDTVFYDSTGIQDITYEYRVSVVDTSSMEGVKSPAVSMTVVSAFYPLGDFGSAGTADGQFQTPTGLASGSDSSIFIADVNNDRIQKFDLNGNFISKFGSSGSDSGQLNAPIDVAIDKNGNIFVADHRNNRIQKFDKQFNLTAIYDSGIVRPKTIAVDGMGNVYINEIASTTIIKLNNDLHFLMKWGHSGSDSSATGIPQCIAIDSLDRIYVADNPTNKIAIFDTLGNFISSILYSSFWKNDQVMIQDISIYGDKLFATDSYNRRILEFDINGNLLSKWGNSNFYSIVFFSNNIVWVTIYPDQIIYMYKRR